MNAITSIILSILFIAMLVVIYKDVKQLLSKDDEYEDKE